ncbi:MAG: DUF4465 domain-containing protein [Crocinitomicaceae bacterium]|nr:DUF4465 domain-containing protein [Crocinitomicaceae bacterium]
MKKILFVFGVSFGCIYSNAQIYCDFEDIGLAPESAWYGQDQVIDGDTVLTSGFYSFENNYNSSWGSFGGWGISNITDNVTTGWSNQFSAIPGGGTGSTGNYGVAYISEFYGNAVYFDLGLDHIDYMYVTNTTYAYFAMLNGDSFSKPFGADTNAQGLIDGTNGEDWFLLTIFGLNADSTRSGDSVNFYLADYRFSDDMEDYIIDDWTAVDLTTLNPAYGLEFELSSSDTSGGLV